MTIVIQLAEAKWIHRVWKLFKLTDDQKQAIRMVSQHIEHGNFQRSKTLLNTGKIIMPKQKRYLSPIQAMCLAGRLQDYAEEKNVEWDDVCSAIIDIVERENTGSVDYDNVHSLGYKIIDEHSNKHSDN